MRKDEDEFTEEESVCVYVQERWCEKGCWNGSFKFARPFFYDSSYDDSTKTRKERPLLLTVAN